MEKAKPVLRYDTSGKQRLFLRLVVFNFQLRNFETPSSYQGLASKRGQGRGEGEDSSNSESIIGEEVTSKIKCCPTLIT